ncbi:MAG TPA: hypothetical protein VOA80_00780 [Thermoanaerobaculia bacterium]|nr:hypothetical protein [Thermoanaerobaculia bacterium]
MDRKTALVKLSHLTPLFILLLAWAPAAAHASPAPASFDSAQSAMPASPVAEVDAARDHPDDPPDAQVLEAWRKAMLKVPLPKRTGCFIASHPSTEWMEVACGTPPPVPVVPAHGHGPATVGNGNDFSAQVSNLLVSAWGTFPTVTGLASESDSQMGSGWFTVQLNTNTFVTPACSRGGPSCRGWQQFVYSQSPNGNWLSGIYMQYWLLSYNTTCPSYWNTYYPGGGQTDCWMNSSGTVWYGGLGGLPYVQVIGTASAGDVDKAYVYTGTRNIGATAQDSVLDLSSGWREAEFNVFGYCCGSEAIFNSGTTFEVRLNTYYGLLPYHWNPAPATCTSAGFTGETNNLSIVGSCSVLTGANPGIQFTESH